MAWVKVYEQLVGPKLRRLAKEIGCSQNEAIGCLVRLWLWGIHNADADGRIIDGDMGDIADALAAGMDMRYEAGKVAAAMAETGWIDTGGGGICLHDWDVWQSQWYRDEEIKRRDAERKRVARARMRGSPANAGEPERQEKQDAGKKTRKKEYPEGFERFWDAYPRRVGKGEAYRKYSARVKDGWSEAELAEAAARYAESVQRNKTDEQFIKHPKTFLSDATPFTDFLKTENAGSQAAYVDGDDPYGDWRE